jgi:hypothetical protein
MSHKKLCPVHRSLIAVSGRVAQVRGIRNEGGRVAHVHTRIWVPQVRIFGPGSVSKSIDANSQHGVTGADALFVG